jgi:hypothetical protein
VSAGSPCDATSRARSSTAFARLLEERFLTLPGTRNVKPSYPRLPAGTMIGFIAQQAVGVVDTATGRVP